MLTLSKRFVLLACLAFALLLGAQALAQQEDPATLYQRVTIHDVADGDTIEAEVERASMTSVDILRRDRQSSMIRLRDNFNRRVLKSVKHL